MKRELTLKQLSEYLAESFDKQKHKLVNGTLYIVLNDTSPKCPIPNGRSSGNGAGNSVMHTHKVDMKMY